MKINKTAVQSVPVAYCRCTEDFSLKVPNVTLCNTNQENKRAKNECSFTLFYVFFKLMLGFGLNFEFGVGLTLGI